MDCPQAPVNVRVPGSWEFTIDHVQKACDRRVAVILTLPDETSRQAG